MLQTSPLSFEHDRSALRTMITVQHQYSIVAWIISPLPRVRCMRYSLLGQGRRVAAWLTRHRGSGVTGPTCRPVAGTSRRPGCSLGVAGGDMARNTTGVRPYEHRLIQARRGCTSVGSALPLTAGRAPWRHRITNCSGRASLYPICNYWAHVSGQHPRFVLESLGPAGVHQGS
jgi:hypothetical protein